VNLTVLRVTFAQLMLDCGSGPVIDG
jgi:hypothetical protein